MKQRPSPLRPDRLRTMESPFGWIPFRFLSSGLLEQLSPPAKLLFFFLCLVADRDGVSFYGPRKITALLGFRPAQLVDAVGELRHADVLAFDGQVYQLLSLPRTVPEPIPRGGQQFVDQLIDSINKKG